MCDDDPMSDVRGKLEALIEEARRNEEKLARFDAFERRLFASRTFPALVHLLLDDYRKIFSLDAVRLLCLDGEGDIARLFEEANTPLPAGLQLCRDVAEIIEQLGGDREVRLARGAMPGNGREEAATASHAVLPLRCGEDLLGGLIFGSCDPDRYAPNVGTRFLERLAAVAALCLDNALAHERLRHAGLTDALTKVYNRRYFEDRCRVEVADALRHRRPLSAMFLDLDHFKRINDTLGHRAGDEVLRAVAQTVQGQLRAGDVLARYGGEEFIVLLPHTDGSLALQVAERIRLAVASRPLKLGDRTLSVTLSIGVAMLDHTADDGLEASMAAMIAAADAAVYQAKRSGRNRVALATAPSYTATKPRPQICAQPTLQRMPRWFGILPRH